MPSQGDSSGDQPVFDWVMNYIRVCYNKPGNVYVGLVHRLDRPVGGVMVLAKTSKAAARLSKLFHDRKVEKTYFALTEGVPKSSNGQLTHYIRKKGNQNISQAFEKEVEDSKLAILDYRVLKTVDNITLVGIRPKTGRRHQIRVQLASIGCPIVGDKKYGSKTFNPDRSIALLAKSISFEHPTKKGEIIVIEAPIPKNEIWKKFAD